MEWSRAPPRTPDAQRNRKLLQVRRQSDTLSVTKNETEGMTMNTDIAASLATGDDAAVVLTGDTIKALRAWYENTDDTPTKADPDLLMAVCSELFAYEPDRKRIVAFVDGDKDLDRLRENASGSATLFGLLATDPVAVEQSLFRNHRGLGPHN